MMITVQPERTLQTPDVAAYLRAKSAQHEYEVTQDAIEEFFPEMRSLNAYLQADPDEDGRAKVVFEVRLPMSIPLNTLGDRRQSFFAELHRRLPSIDEPVCGLLLDVE